MSLPHVDSLVTLLLVVQFVVTYPKEASSFLGSLVISLWAHTVMHP